MSDLKEFEEQLRNMQKQQPTNQQPVQPPPGSQPIQVVKNIVLSYVSDAAGCGHIRNIFPMTFINSIFAKTGAILPIITPFFIFQEDLLARTKALYFQRQMTPEHLQIIRIYKEHQPRLQYKMIWEIDDFIWGHNELQGGTKEDGVPSYNFGYPNITDDIKSCSVEIMKLMDHITVSTQFLADYIKNELKVNVPITVLQNTIPSYFWGNVRKTPITERIKKPRVIYTGSPTHYRNPLDARPPSPQEPNGFPGDPVKMLGDFDNAWKDWVIKSVNNDKIEFICMGGLPWFFNEIKDKITILNWVDSFKYHMLVKEQKADFGIMPLTCNNFNRGKSDIKAIEHYADGVVCIGTTFIDGTPSPYDNNPLSLPIDCTVEDIDNLFDMYCEPEHYNFILEEQYKKLNTEGRWLESPDYINKFVNILMN